MPPGGRSETPPPRVEIRLENQRRRHLISELAPPLPAEIPRKKRAFGGRGRQALVPEVNRNRHRPAERLGERLSPPRRRTRCPVHVPGPSDDDPGGCVLPAESRDAVDVLAKGTVGKRDER